MATALIPACLPIFQRLGIATDLPKCPHALVDWVDFITIGGRKLRTNLPTNTNRMITMKRSILDDRLLNRAREVGTQVHTEATVVTLHKTRERDWKIDIVREMFLARILVGADGRNSTVARLCNLLPRPERERIALQAHVPLPPDFGNRIVLQLLPEGYSGQAPVNENELNLCLVGTPPTIASLRAWAEREFKLPGDQQWRTITPLTRAPIPSVHENLFFIGDAARVVEPFTGEGIYYALRSGELAANAIVKIIRDEDRAIGSERICSRSSRDVSRPVVDQPARACSCVTSPSCLKADGHYANQRAGPTIANPKNRQIDCRAALTVFDISMAIVIGPTPPGTGVIAFALGATSSNATSPTSR